MGYKIKPKYPLFLRGTNKGSVNEKEIRNIINTQKGYPKTVVEGGTGIINLYAKANTFYDIKNTPDDAITIQQNIFDVNSINGELFIVEFDDIEGLEAIFPNYTEENLAETKAMLSTIIVSKESNKYKLYLYTPGKNIMELSEVDNLDSTDLEISIQGIVLTVKNVKFIEPNYNIGGYPVYLEEVKNDNPEYKYKYKIINNYLIMTTGLNVYYSNTSIDELTYVYIDHFKIPIIKDNFKSLYDKNVGEFVFNFNTPTEIIFDKEIKWNNDEEPDLTQSGIMTISIVNGIGSYTFVNS